jgi:hypothetical protein
MISYSKENTVLRQARSIRDSRKACCPRYSALLSADICKLRKLLLNEEILKTFELYLWRHLLYNNSFSKKKSAKIATP